MIVGENVGCGRVGRWDGSGVGFKSGCSMKNALQWSGRPSKHDAPDGQESSDSQNV